MRIMKILFLFSFLLSVGLAVKHPLSKEFIDELNSQQNLWKAGQNFDPESNLRDVRRRCGVPGDFKKYRKPALRRTVSLDGSPDSDLPLNFDLRTEYPNCTSIRTIYDQGECGSCWAVSAVRSMTDRICIASNGRNKTNLSPQNLLACCDDCGLQCMGGYPIEAWDYWVDFGIVSGGAFNSKSGCQPYEIGSCGSTVVNSNSIKCPSYNLWPDCVKRCTNPSYTKSYVKDRNFGRVSYAVDDSEITIMREIKERGTVQATFDVYAGFLDYKSGIYVKTSRIYMGAHAVRMIGWGVLNGTKYWLCANAWGTQWGDNGFFKIRRGTNECGIEADIIAGIPKL